MFTNKNVHMIGIGGVSMSGIAEILLSFGCKVTGYDANQSEITDNLTENNVNVTFEPCFKNIDNADIVVYTAAIHEDNPELSYARKNNKEIYERGEFLGMLMKCYENVLCISGTHGKSTTTGMVSTIFLEANLNPTISIGAKLPAINSNYYIGGKKYFIVEACEYVDSFLKFFPTSEIILNIDNDHLDYFKNLDNIIKSFKKYMNRLPENGILVVNNDDKNTLKALDNKKAITYGIENNSDYMAKNISYDEYGHGKYDLYINDTFIIEVSLSVSGIHNIYNSLSAIALSSQYIDDISFIAKALKSYTGVGRRFEFIGKYNNANIYDDYAHHPSEMITTLESVKKTKHNKSWAIFQSHTYSRTKDHMDSFAKVLSKFDNVIIAPIFPAREKNIWNVKESDIVEKIKSYGNDNVTYIDSFDKIVDYIKPKIKENDLVITIGAGPINKVANEIAK